MQATLERIREAKKQARAHGYPMALVTVDHEDSRRLEIWSLGATMYAEFEAFDGRVELIVNPDGTIDD